MKILYAIQGTGNGHLSRAREIIPVLEKKGDLDLLVSGTQVDVSLSCPITYRFKGLSFYFGKQGGIDYGKSIFKAAPLTFFRDVFQLPVWKYDVILNDFEPVSAWACRLRRIPCTALSHQAAVIHPEAPKPAHSDWFATQVLHHYAPASLSYGFHFTPVGKKIFPPVIRSAIRQIQPTDEGHYTVYLPAYGDQELIRLLQPLPGIKWHIFSRHTRSIYHRDNCSIRPISDKEFTASLASASGVLTGAGFETPAEALFLGKKLMVIPMRSQYEQHCNSAALHKLGVSTIPALDDTHLPAIADWVQNGKPVHIPWEDRTKEILNEVIEASMPFRSKEQ